MPATKTSSPPPQTTAQATLYQQLRAHLAVLKLYDAAEHLPAVLDAATAKGLSLTAALERLLAVEVDATEARLLVGRLRFASLPTPATLAEFDYDAAPGVDRALIDELATCRYLASATNILLIGPPGTGKTHLALGLVHAAAEAGYRTYFTTAADLAARCHRAAIEGRWATTMRFFAGPTLLAIDLCRRRHRSTRSASPRWTTPAPSCCSGSSQPPTNAAPWPSPRTGPSRTGAGSYPNTPRSCPSWTASCTTPPS